MQRKIFRQNRHCFRVVPTAFALPAFALLALAGCRNTTNSPIYPANAGTPLAPVQGTATLSPIQPTAGFSTLGAPTRVPPPPTGSFSAPNNAGASSNYAIPPSNYAPNNFGPAGAAVGPTGMTQGVTQLNPVSSPGLQPSGSAVRQTGWVGENGAVAPNPGTGNQGVIAPAGGSPAPIAPSNPRNGGMQVIDLTGSPYPPGYVPPQNRPGAGSFPQNAPFPSVAPASSLQPLPQVNATTSPPPAVQPDPSRFVRSAAAMPSTEPFPSNGNPAAQSLEWRRPSPRF